MKTRDMYFFVRENWTPNTIFYTFFEITDNSKIVIDCKEDCWEIELFNNADSTFLKIPSDLDLQVCTRGLPLDKLNDLIRDSNKSIAPAKSKEYSIDTRYDPQEENMDSVRLIFHPTYHIEINIEKQR